MVDIKLSYSDTLQGFDFGIESGDLERDGGIESAIAISLFTDQRATEDDPLPGAQDDRRGWWGDIAGNDRTDQIGSKLWLLGRSKNITKTVDDAKVYAEAALQWLLDDGVAAEIDVEAEAVDKHILGLQVRVKKSDGSEIAKYYEYVWGEAA